MRDGWEIVSAEDPRLSIPGREESWEVDVLDANDEFQYTLGRMLAARVTQNRYLTIRGGAYVEFVPDPARPVNFLNERLRIWQYVQVRGHRLCWPWLTGLPQSPELARSSTGQAIRVDLLDKMSVLDQDVLPDSYSLPAGTLVTGAVRQLILDAGEPAGSIAITDSPLMLRAPMSWEGMTSRLRIINDLLDTISYFSIWCDGGGKFQAAPYTLPADRVPVRQFVAGPESVHKARMFRKQDLAGIPNRVICRTRPAYDTPALQHTEDNTNPDSPFSYQGRGNRWLVDAQDGVEAADLPTLVAMTKRAMAEKLAPTATWAVEHASMPIYPNQAAIFQPLGMEPMLITVASTEITLSVGADVKAQWQEVPRW